MKSLAIIGTGIAGLGCAWFLHERYRITVFEQNGYAGGHTNTITVDEAGRPVAMDTGFMVFNHVTYPLLTRLFSELGVETKPTDMSFSVQHVPTGLEYNGGNINLLFGQRRNLFSLRHWKMLMAINRFNAEAVPALQDSRYAEMTLREYVAERGYGDDMLNFYLVPMSSAVWSSPPEHMMDFPAVTLLRFWHNHGFLGLDTRHQWYTVVGGSRNYIKPLTAGFSDRVMLNRRAQSVKRENGKAQIAFADGTSEEFDKVILACHGDQAWRLLADPTSMESDLLPHFKYQPNTATVHTDERFMPGTRRCWASWNYRIEKRADGSLDATTHYWMNSLQDVSQRRNYFVSLNCRGRVAPEKVLREIDYEHPLFDLAAVKAQGRLPALNMQSPDQMTYFAGAWFKYGFHEDGLSSALDCANAVAGEEVWS